MENYQVKITNGVTEKIEEVPKKYAENQEDAEKMVEGLINTQWKVIKQA